MSFFSTLSQFYDDALIQSLAKSNGEKPEKVQKSISILTPALVAGLVKRVTTETGLNLIYNNAIKSTATQDDLVAAMTDKTQFASLVSSGDKILNMLLPSAKGPVVNMIVQHTSVRNSLAGSLCSSMMPVVMNVLKTEIESKKHEPADLANYLLNQREEMLSSLPNDFIELFIEQMGLKNHLGAVNVPQITTENVEQKSPTTKDFLTRPDDSTPIDLKPVIRWIAILAVLGGIGWGGYYLWSNWDNFIDSDTETVEARTIVEPIEKDSVTAADTLRKATTLTAAENPFEKYLKDSTAKKGKTLKWDNVDFVSNSTKLTPEAESIVKQLGDLLKNRPSTQIKIIGYANDAQLPMTNKMLSIKRVIAIKQRLIDQGINFVRVDAEGRGDGVNLRDSTRQNRIPLREYYIKFVQK